MNGTITCATGATEKHQIGQTIIIIDASNIAHQGRRKASLNNILAIREELEQYGTVILLADASLKYKIDDPSIYDEYVGDGTILQVPAGTSADRHITKLAMIWLERGACVCVVSNDNKMTTKLCAGINSLKVLSVVISDYIDNIFTPNLGDILNVPTGVI